LFIGFFATNLIETLAKKQNTIHQYLKKRIYAWLKANAINEAKQGETEEQIPYKTRKKR
jgi:hypothetical protein